MALRFVKRAGELRVGGGAQFGSEYRVGGGGGTGPAYRRQEAAEFAAFFGKQSRNLRLGKARHNSMGREHPLSWSVLRPFSGSP